MAKISSVAGFPVSPPEERNDSGGQNERENQTRDHKIPAAVIREEGSLEIPEILSPAEPRLSAILGENQQKENRQAPLICLQFKPYAMTSLKSVLSERLLMPISVGA
jgi:hypothetical protein